MYTFFVQEMIKFKKYSFQYYIKIRKRYHYKVQRLTLYNFKQQSRNFVGKKGHFKNLD